MKKYSTLLLMVLLPLMGWGQIYKYRNQEGVVVFSDEPTADAETVELGPLQSYSSGREASRSQEEVPLNESTKAFKGYTHFNFLAPKPKETIKSNAGIVNIDIALDPVLQRGHRMVILLDGKSVIQSKNGTSFHLKGVERGTHLLLGTVENATGKVIIKTNPQTLFLEKTSMALPKKPLKMLKKVN